MAIKREKTAFVVPNAISVQTSSKRVSSFILIEFGRGATVLFLEGAVGNHSNASSLEISFAGPKIKVHS